jgi:hypothetical protein
MKLKLSSIVAGLLLVTTAGFAAETVVISPEQETTVREYVKKQPLASIKLPGVELNIGSTLPETVELHRIPDVQYEYVVVEGHTVLVEPETRRIVRVLD